MRTVPGIPPHGLIGAAEVEVGSIDMAAALDQLLEVDGGFARGFGLHADRGHGEAQVIVGGVLLNRVANSPMASSVRSCSTSRRA